MTASSSLPGLATRLLKSVRRGFQAVFLVSAALNVLVLGGSLFAVQVYDRVLPSRSIPTLVSLLSLMAVAYAAQAVLETLRARILSRMGASIDRDLIEPVCRAIQSDSLAGSTKGDGMQLLRDTDQVRNFLSGPGPAALFDLPWLPLLVGLTVLLHPWLAAVTLAGGAFLIGLLLLSENRLKPHNAENTRQLSERNTILESLRRGAGTTATMGIAEQLQRLILARHDLHVRSQIALSDITANYGATSRMARQLLQAIILSLGAWLVIEGQASAGIMFAASILTGRTLAPIEAAIAHWRQLQATRQSLARLDASLTEPTSDPTAIPAPSTRLDVEALTVTTAARNADLLAGINFGMKAGEMLLVLGASGSGKSTLARSLMGLQTIKDGSVRLDGASLDQWSNASRGSFCGYLPQTVELFDGSIAQNISRFAPDASPDAIVEAAKRANVHELIVSLPSGYDTRVGSNGLPLSGGQRQRIGLARALFGNPFLIVLDEPNAALDAEGDAALRSALSAAKAMRAIVVVISHRSNLLPLADKVLWLANGRQVSLGTAGEFMKAARHNPRGGVRPNVADIGEVRGAATAA